MCHGPPTFCFLYFPYVFIPLDFHRFRTKSLGQFPHTAKLTRKLVFSSPCDMSIGRLTIGRLLYGAMKPVLFWAIEEVDISSGV